MLGGKPPLFPHLVHATASPTIGTLARVSMNYHTIVDRLAVGPYPADPAQVMALKRHGITAILNVQSDADFRDRAIQWNLFWKFYVSRGIHVVRCPITDFDSSDLSAKLPGAIEALQALIVAEHSVYLHCTAGVNRSPTVAIGWLMTHGGYDMAGAVEHFLNIRKVAAPDLHALRRLASSK